MNNIVENLKFLLKERCVEVRMLQVQGRGTVSAYYDDFEKLARDIAFYNGKTNIFFTINEFNKDIAARSYNRLTNFAKYTTKDDEIVRRRYVLIDVDAKRPSGVSSTDEEHEAALNLASLIKDELGSEGFDCIIRCDSGNGGHLLIPVDMPNNDESTNLIRNFLNVLDEKYSNDVAEVDISTYNASRITKLYGTVAVKGVSMHDRPHRESKILEDIDNFVIRNVDRKVIEEYVSKHKVTQKSNETKVNFNQTNSVSKSNEVFNVPAWVEKHGYKVTKQKRVENGELYQINQCMFGNGHNEDGGMCIIQHDNGFLSAKCLHAKCANESFATLWSKYEKKRKNPNEKTKKSSKGSDDKSIADIVLEIIEERSHVIFKNQFNELYVQIPELSNLVIKLESGSYMSYLIKLYYEREKVAVKKEHVKTAVEVLKATQMFNSTYKPTFQRLGCIEGDEYFYYLNDEEQRVVSICKQEDGKYDYEVREQDVKCAFVKNSVMKAQYAPNKEKKPPYSLLKYMEKYYSSLSKQELLVHNVLLCYRFLYGLAQPIGVYIGQRGSGKSTLASFDAMIVNPTVNSVTSKPKNDKDWIVLLNNTDLVVIDNISTLTVSESDLLCQAIQNYSVSSQRRLYTDDDLMIYNLYSSIYMTSIKLVSYQTDLLDRSIFFHTQRFDSKHRKEETKFRQEFESDLPNIMTSIFETLVTALNLMEEDKDRDDSNEYVVRIASFQKYGQYIAEALGYSKDEFIEALLNNTKEIQSDLIADNDFVNLIKDFVEEKHYVKGTPTEVLRQLNKFCINNDRVIDKYSNTPAKLGRALSEYNETLENAGIAVIRSKSNGTRFVELADKSSPRYAEMTLGDSKDVVIKDGYNALLRDLERLDELDNDEEMTF